MNNITASPSSGIIQRIVSLDAFRGFIMLSMLMGTLGLEKLSDNPVLGFLLTQLSHVPWTGFHFEDLILPSFLCIIGISMAISDRKRRERGDNPRQCLLHALKRSAGLFALGFLLSWLSARNPTWAVGVLQVLALSYFGAFLFIRLSIRAQFAVFFGLLFIYWFFVFIIPVYEVGRNSYEVNKNLVYYIDDVLTGKAGRWGYIYALLTNIAPVVYGSIVGKLLLDRTDDNRFMKTLAILGISGAFIGLALSPFMPLSHRMNTSTYAIFTCGLATLLLLGFFWVIDVKNFKKWSIIFVVIGMNSIFIYMLNGFFSRWLMDTGGSLLNPIAVYIDDAWIPPIKNVFRLVVEWLVCFWCYKRGIFFKL
jgi:heparan-alpha-glucosaminide N-acetyltransferase